MSNTFTIQLLMDYEALHEQYGWEVPTEAEAYDEDENGNYINAQYWQSPWSDDDLKAYEIEQAVFYFNQQNDTDIDPDDVKQFEEIERTAYCSTYQFTV